MSVKTTEVTERSAAGNGRRRTLWAICNACWLTAALWTSPLPGMCGKSRAGMSKVQVDRRSELHTFAHIPNDG
jgi:hypothetical protein